MTSDPLPIPDDVGDTGDSSIVVDGPSIVMADECLAPAPAVANGGGYLGCGLVKGHDGPHSVVIQWGP